RQNNLGGVIALGQPGDEPVLGEGWARRESADGAGFRRVRGRARVLAPLDVPEDLNLRVRLACPTGDQDVRVSVNGQSAGQLAAGPAWNEATLFVEARAWRRELNEVVFEADGEDVRVGSLTFVQRAAR